MIRNEVYAMKRVSTLVLCMVLVLSLMLPAGAEEPRSFLHPLMLVDDTAVSLVGLPSGGGTVTVEVNGATFTDFTVKTLEDAGLPVTYYCMVDQSTSFSLDQRNQQRRGISVLSSNLRPEDSLVLAAMGTSLTIGKPLTSQESRTKAIEETVVHQSYSTPLHDHIIKTMKAAAQAQQSGSFSCVVLFTDGLDDQQRQNSRQEAMEAVSASGVSLYTVSVMSPTNDQFVVNNARQMTEFAQASLGGVGCVPALDKADSTRGVEEAIAEITNRVLSSSVIQLNAASLPREGSLDVTVTCYFHDTQLSDTISIDPVLLPPLPTEPPTTAPATTAPATTVPETTVPEITMPETTLPTAKKASNPGNRLFFFALICLLAAAVLIAVSLVLLRRRREEEAMEQEPIFTGDPSKFLPQDDADIHIELDFFDQKDAAQGEPDPVFDLDHRMTTPACRVQLVPEDHPQGALAVTIQANDSVTLGRNNKAQIILNESDTALSGLHLELQWDSRALYLRDRHSTNGTALNGVPLRPDQWTRLENKAVIQAGSVKYTLIIE